MDARPIDLAALTERQRAAFEKKIDRSNSGCWPWTAARKTDYGHTHIGSKKEGTFHELSAHRLAWQIANPSTRLGPSDFVLHKCDNPLCCNASHLFIGTQLDNMRDMIAKRRANKVRGEQHGCARLTERKVREIRDSDAMPSVLAARFRVSSTTISDIQQRRRWKHVV